MEETNDSQRKYCKPIIIFFELLHVNNILTLIYSQHVSNLILSGGQNGAIVPAIQKSEARGLFEPRSLRLAWAISKTPSQNIQKRIRYGPVLLYILKITIFFVYYHVSGL